MNERIRILRDQLHLSRAAFGSKLGVSGDVINNLERGRVDVKETMVKLICSEFSVNESWLRSGTGDMFAQPATFCLDDFAAERGATSLELELIKAYFELDSDVRKAVIEHFKKRLRPDQESVKAQIDTEVDAYRADLELEARQASSASDMPDAKEA